jgi:hypothetical protein
MQTDFDVEPAFSEHRKERYIIYDYNRQMGQWGCFLSRNRPFSRVFESRSRYDRNTTETRPKHGAGFRA